MAIIVEKGIPENTAWVKSFSKIAKAWEAFSSNQGIDINGRLNAYQVMFDLNLDDIQYSVCRQMENIRSGGGPLRPNPYSEVIEITTTLRQLSPGFKLYITRNHFLYRLRGFIRRVHSQSINKRWLLQTNRKLENINPSILDLTDAAKLHYIKVQNRIVYIRLLSIPASVNEIKSLHSIIERILYLIQR